MDQSKKIFEEKSKDLPLEGLIKLLEEVVRKWQKTIQNLGKEYQ